MIKFNYGDAMSKKKIIMIIIVIILVVGLSFLFIKLFDFEGQTNINNEHNESKEVDEQTIHQLYSYFLENNELEYNGVHSTYFIRNNNLANQNARYVQAMLYQYILNYDEFSLETLSTEELNTVVSNQDNYTPLYKVSLASFEKALKVVLGPDITYRPTDFDYTKSIKAKFNDELDYYYIYDTNEKLETNFIEYKEMARYAVSEDEIKIYDYYLKCDTTTNNCYNDENRSSINSNIKYSTNFDVNNYLNNITTYEHTFKYNSDTDNYYWYSSQMI